MKVVGISLMTVASALLSGAVGCAAPASVEGVFASQDFRLNSEAPLWSPTASGRDIVVVLAESDSETLRTVSILIPFVDDIELGAPLDVFDGGSVDDPRPVLEVSTGKLLIEKRADGAEIISSTDAVRGVSRSGTLTLDERTAETCAGSFSVDLDDGGYLNGAFVASPSQ